MRALALVFVAALAAPALADEAPAEDAPAPSLAIPVTDPLALPFALAPPKEVIKPATDLAGFFKDPAASIKAWLADPYHVSLGMTFGDVITVRRLRF